MSRSVSAVSRLSSTISRRVGPAVGVSGNGVFSGVTGADASGSRMVNSVPPPRPSLAARTSPPWSSGSPFHPHQPLRYFRGEAHCGLLHHALAVLGHVAKELGEVHPLLPHGRHSPRQT